MEIIAKYVHGSEDSTDTDTYYVVDELPSFADCKEFCDCISDENANLITIEDGVVTGCYKGTIDEVNNSLLDTYPLHRQSYSLLVTKRLERNVELKHIRAVRGILSHLSRSRHRTVIKNALKSSWSERLGVLDAIDLTEMDFGSLNGHMSGEDVKKVIAFQIGQSLGLSEGKEFYTKRSVADCYGELEPYLYRSADADVAALQKYLKAFVQMLRGIDFEEDGTLLHFMASDKSFDLKMEREIKTNQ